MSGDWRSDRGDLAAAHILDVAEDLFVESGVGGVTMRDLAKEVGCSRPTLYRYYPNKAAVLGAYVERAARRLAATILAIDAGGPAANLTEAIVAAVDGVRRDRALSAWFAPDAAVTSSQLALLSPAIEAITTEFLGRLLPGEGLTDPDVAGRARYLVRVIVSLLTNPEPSATAEREMLERFVVPTVLAAP